MADILIIDDDLPLLHFMRETLERAGRSVSLAPAAVEGIWKFEHERPRIVLLSVHVRRGLGWDTMDELRGRDPSVPLVALGSMTSSDAEARALKSGCAGYISKQLGLKEFEQAVKLLVDRLLPSPKGETMPQSKGKILVVDDDEQIRTVLQRFLERKGYEVRTASNGEEALSMIKKERPHIMLLDINMPVMSGMEVLKVLPEVDKELAVMMLTGNGDETLAREAMERGAVDYIPKPMNLNYLETTLMAKIVLMTS
jgi:DNA-binding response OmpR family regulator